MPFYWSYIGRWPDMMSVQENASGRVSSYMIGKAEGRGLEWHGHISAVTVAPEFRRLGLARTLCNELERVSDKVYRGHFADLFVRVSNVVAIQMYRGMGYTVYRRVLRYYDGDEDAFDMRKPLSRDPAGKTCAPLKAPVTARDLQPTR
jgi:N-terminal acetyltransferase B complex catalytic subunit